MLENLFRRRREKPAFQPFEVQFENGVCFAVSQHSENELDIKLTKNSEVVYDFKDPECVPKGTKFFFNPSTRWSADIDLNGKGDPFVNCENFRGIEDIPLSLFHELGHLNHLEETKAGAVAFKEFDERKKSHPPLTPDEIIRMHETVLRSERLAFEWALKKTKELEQKFGITILSKIGREEEIQEIIGQLTNTYIKPFRDAMPRAVNLAMRHQRK